MNDAAQGEGAGVRMLYGLSGRKRGTQKWQQISSLSNDGDCFVALQLGCPASGLLKINCCFLRKDF